MQQSLSLCLLLLLLSIMNCQSPATESIEEEREPIVVIREEPADALAKAKDIRANTAIELADGLVLDLWATDSLAPDPIAMSIDDAGRVYLTRTNRQKNSEFDIRGHQDWMTASISLQSVEDRRNFLRKTFAPEKSEANSWLPDLNGDGVHDWKDLTVEKDEVWRLEDEAGSGVATVSTRILRDFHEEITDVAGALLVREEDMFVGIGPDMWRLQDTDEDGIPDTKESISHGYAVHIGFGAHGMSGAIEGPDGKIYWGIGDIGANIETADGTHYRYPNQGILVRSNPDGSDFEVFAAGLRNTHEFVFDAYGNIIGADNDGDHPGESERLVHIVEGSDAGWRANWQYGKYTDPKNNGYNVWMDEALYKPRWDGQAAYIMPPIQNFHNGPTGMAYNPGTALGEAWKNKFFLVEFVGNPSRSPVWAFDLQPKGASFVLGQEEAVVKGILPTGIRFGPDGALYIADWLNGWGTKNAGRVWRLDVTSETNDLADARAETQRLMQLDYAEQSTDQLSELLSYDDMRIRQKAQFALVKRGDDGAAVLREALTSTHPQLMRIHGIWGLGQLAREEADFAEALLPLLADGDPEIVAQAAKILGDVKYQPAADALLPLLQSEQPRVQFFSAQALGRLAYKPAVQPILNMLVANDGKDLYLRHAGVLALTRIQEVQPVLALADSPNKELRTVAVLVLRRLKNEEVAIFLQDQDEYIVTETARAINDDLSIVPALPALAAILDNNRFTAEPLLRRAINANLRVGGEPELDRLIAFIQRKGIASGLKAEALAALATWANPSVLDRVDGRYRGEITRDPEPVKQKVSAYLPTFLADNNPDILVATLQMLGELKITDYNQQILDILQKNSAVPVRVAALQTLHQLEYSAIAEVIKTGMADRAEEVRAAAIGLLEDVDVPDDQVAGLVQPIFERGTVREQQAILRVLAAMPTAKSEPVLTDLVEQMINEKLSPDIKLELLEAVDSTHSAALIAKTDAWRSTEEADLAAYEVALYGGNEWQGRRYFRNNSAGQCARCHAVKGEGGEVGPDLTNIGAEMTREQLLEALILPSARLAPGYGMVILTLKDGQTASGTLIKETDTEIFLKTNNAEPLEIPLARVAERENIPSSMPAMGPIMSKREVRDVIAYLASLKPEQ